MARFKASTVERIEWDFQGSPKRDPDTGEIDGKFANGDPMASGTLPEPSDSAVDRYMSGIRDIARALTVDTLEDVSDDQFTRARVMIEDLLVDVGAPRELLERLPPRQLKAFSLFLQGEISGNADGDV